MLLAYIISRKRFLFRSQLSLFWVITMYVNGGMIPTLVLYRNMNLTNSFWVYVIPGMVSAFNVLVMRTFMEGLPSALEESAMIDGANDFTIFTRIISPLCKPVYATVALFVAVGQWNSWFDAMLYNRMNTQYTTLQYELMKLLSSVMQQSGSATTGVQRQADFMEHRRAGPVGEAQLFDLKENGAGLHGDGGRRLDGLDAVQAAGGLLGRDGIASVRQGGAQRTADPRECRGLHPQLLEVGAGEDLLRGIKGDLPALVQQQDAVAVGGNLLDLLLNHQDGDAAAGQLVHGAEHFLAALRVQLGGGFVQHQDVGVHDQHAGDGHALHLAARKVKGVAVAVLPDVQQFEGFLGAAVHLLPGDAQVLHRLPPAAWRPPHRPAQQFYGFL